LPFEFRTIEQISLKLRGPGPLPQTEINDSFIFAEAALLGCGLFLTSDSHFLELDFKLVMLELKACNVSVPVIASPRELVRKFYR